MLVDTVTLTEEVIYERCKTSPALQALIPDPLVAGEVKVYPHPAPEGVVAPFITHDIAGDERSAMPIGGGPGQFVIPWWVAVWSDQISRQSLRPTVLAVQTVLVGAEMRGISTQFTSGDGTSWQITIRRDGAMPAPAGVDDSGRWHRVMVRYVVELLNAA